MLFSSYVVKAAEMKFVQKICTFNIDEIDYKEKIFEQIHSNLNLA